METARDNSSSADLRTGPATNSGELHQTSPLTEQGNGIKVNSHLEAQPSSLSSPQNPFLVPTDAYESSPGNPFQEPTKTNDKATGGAFESWQNQPSAYETVPINAESHNPFPTKEQDTTNAPPKLGLDSHVAAESSDDDIPISSMPKHGHSGDVAGVQSSAAVSPGSNWGSGTIKGPEIQNPPVQVMERPGDSGTSSSYTFPSHVFARNNTNAPVEWSTASNESLFSIYMGNMSFSSEIPYFGKSAELDKPGEIYNMPDQPNASPNQQPPAAAAPVNKFNDISQRTAELHEECSKITEAKAFETMREVIMETSRTNENAAKGEDRSSNSHRQSDGSTKSFAFQSGSSKGATEKQQKQQKQTEQKETANAVDQAPKSTTNAPPNRWLSCFSCCR